MLEKNLKINNPHHPNNFNPSIINTDKIPVNNKYRDFLKIKGNRFMIMIMIPIIMFGVSNGI